MNKPRLIKSSLDNTILDLMRTTDHAVLIMWACDCAERVLPYFERHYPDDHRPRLAIESGRTLLRTGLFRMADVRQASLEAHAAAREVADDDAARSAARAAGQAMATAHVPTHATAAASYAAAAVRDGSEADNRDVAAADERRWQYQHLLSLRKQAALS